MGFRPGGLSTLVDSERRPTQRGNAKRHRRSLRVQLLVTVNAVAFVGLAAWLLQEYRRELTDQLANTRSALTNEARVLAPLLANLHHSQPAAMQARIDEVCMSMRTEDSPEHHIVVRTNGKVYESAPHPENDDSNSAQHHSASEVPRENTAYDPPISGSYQFRGFSVEVSKSAKVVMREVRRRAVGRLLITAVGVLALALIANLIIVQLVNRPLTRLVAVVREIGAGRLGLTPDRFNTAELDFLSEEIGEMSRSLAAIEQDRRVQLATARQLQEHLHISPSKLLELDLAAAYLPADNIAGDYYDALPLRHARCEGGPMFMLCLADVCGHGVPAAMGAAMLKTLLLDACDRTCDPGEVLSHLNRRFAEVSLPGHFATMFVAAVRPGADHLVYASAGHEYCYLVGLEGRVCPLAATGIPIGIDLLGGWETNCVPVRAGDRLLLVSDGVTEAVDVQNKQFGRERLAELLRSAAADTSGLVRSVQSALAAHVGNAALRDDVTIVAACLDRCGAALPADKSPPLVVG